MDQILFSSKGRVLLIAILFIGIICGYGNKAFAQQRSIDWEAISVSPSGNVTNGGGLPLVFKFKNHGPDTWLHGDSILYVLSSIHPDGQEHIAYTGILYNYYGDFDSGQTLVYNDGYQITFNEPSLTAPLTMDFCLGLYTRAELSNGDSLILSYDDPDYSNNVSCQQVTVYPDGSTAINDPAVEGPFDFSFFPNPSRDRLMLRLKNNTKGMSVTLNDITGKQVLKTYFDRQSLVNGSQILDIARFPDGIYLLRVQSDGRSATKKLVIQH